MADNITGSFSVSLNLGSDKDHPLVLKSSDLNSSPLTFQLKEGTAPQVNTADLVNWISTSLQSLGFTSLPDGLATAAPQVTIDKLSISTDETFNLEAKFIFGQGQGWEIIPGMFTLDNVGIQVGNLAQEPAKSGNN